MPIQKDTQKISTACSNCRERKVKCSGGTPCRNCLEHGKECFYPLSQRRKRSKADQSPSVLETRLSRMEALLQVTDEAGLSEYHPDPTLYQRPTEPPTPSRTSPVRRDELDRRRSDSHAYSVRSPAVSRSADFRTDTMEVPPVNNTVFVPFQSVQSPPPTVSTLSTRDSVTRPPQRVLPSKESTNQGETCLDDEESVIPLQKVNWEHHGPGSWVSVCSQPGLKWVCERTGTTEFIESAKGLTHAWTRRLTIKRDDTTSPKAPELDEELASKYTAAYFEHSYDAVFGVVYRPEFEARLRIHLDHGSSKQDDPSWFALRNIVYAAGCRCILARDPSVSFLSAQAQAWQYFENAFSVFAELLFSPTGFSAVQALALMTFYVEGLGSPALEYSLCANAARMAQAKGLHRQPAKSWALPDHEVLHRNWLWWAIYCCEKQIAFRSGRPSAIDDDNISAQIPTATAPGSTIDIDIFTNIIKHAQISSQISKRLMSVKAFQQSTSELINTVTDLHNQLQQFRDALPPYLQPSIPIKPSQDFQSTSRLTHIIYIHFAFYGSLMATHILLFYPWISARFGTETNPTFRAQVAFSSNTVAEAARSIILAARFIATDVATPAWLAFYYPILSHINLFIYILKYPVLPSTNADVALLDVCAGHFGHMEFVTSSEISFPFTREAAALARKTVKTIKEMEKEKARSGGAGVAGVQVRNDSHEIMSLNHINGGLNGTNGGQRVDFPEVVNDMDDFNVEDFDMESWNIFSSVDVVPGMGELGTFSPEW